MTRITCVGSGRPWHGHIHRILLFALLFPSLRFPALLAAPGDLVRTVRYKISAGDLFTGEAAAAEYKREHGVDAEYLGAVGWLARGSALLGKTERAWRYVAARSREQGLSDVGSLDLGFLGAIPIPSTFNYQANDDYKKANYENMDAELNIQLGDHWVARGNYSWNARDTTYKVTGLAQWNVMPTAAYNTATKSVFDYLTEYLADPVAVLNDPTKTASVLLPRRKQVQFSQDYFNTYEVDLTGKYELAGIKLNPLFGAYRQYGNTGGGYTRGTSTSTTSGAAGSAYSNTDTTLSFAPWNYFDSSTWDKNLAFDESALPAPSSAPSPTYTREIAYYGVLTATMMQDRLILVGGARSDRYQSGGADGYSFDAKKTTPQAGLGFHVTKDSLLFANYSKSFLVDGTSLTVPNPAYDPTIKQNSSTNPQFIKTPATPTTGLGYEVGLKTDFLNGRVSSTLTAFHLERADRIVTSRQPVFGLSNTGVYGSTDVTFSHQGTVDQSEGIEFELTYSPLDNWQIYATYANMQIQTTKITLPTMRLATDPAVSGDYAAYVAGYNEAVGLLLGATPEGSAEILSSLWSRYTFNEGSLKGLWVAGGGNYTSPKAQRTSNPNLFFPAYCLWDAAIGYDWKHRGQSWSVTLNVKNIADQVYYPANQSRGNPRDFILSVGTRF